MQHIFEYTNYRDYLKDFYHERKSLDGYTYRDFAAQAHMNSSSWLLHLIDGSKNLSSETALTVSKILGFKKKESEYFGLLVLFTQAKNSETKDRYFQKIISLKRSLHISKLTDEQYDYYKKWYNPVIRSLVSKVDFKEDYSLLGRKVVPHITAAEAKRSVNLLKRLGLIVKNTDGNWAQANPTLSTGDEIMSLNVVNYHKQVSKLAEGAFDRSPRDARDISSLTMGINKKDFTLIKEKIQAFRKEIMKIAQNSEQADRVYQCNFQFFPVSEIDEENNHV